MNHLILVFVAVMSFGGTCGQVKPTPIEPTDTADCAGACQHLQDLGCEEGEPLEDGTTCEAFCEATQKSGHALRPACIITIPYCEAMEELCMTEPRAPDE